MASWMARSLRAGSIFIVHSKGIIMKAAGIAATVVLVGVMSNGYAVEAPDDGNQLLSACKPLLNYINNDATSIVGSEGQAGECLGLTEGVRKTMMQLNSNLPPKMRTCFPSGGINNGQAIRIVVKFLENNPEKLNLDRTLLTMLAYDHAYHCK